MTGTRRIAVVGGGWSGLAAALALADAGCEVTLLEAAPQLGGRARRVELALGDRSFPLDNGQHLLIGAYRDTLALMRRVGVDPDRAFLRLPFTLRYADGFRMRAARWPAPLHLAGALLGARGLTYGERIALALCVHRWRRAGWRTASGAAAIDLLRGAPPALVERLWQPLCLAALNVRLEQASASVFLAVLRDSLGAERAASDLLLARVDLSALLPDAGLSALQAAGATVRLRWAVDRMQPLAPGWRLAARTAELDCDAVVLALPPWRAAALLARAGLAALDAAANALTAIEAAPIATVYLRYARAPALPLPVMPLVEAPERNDYGQWVFDRGALDPRCAGVASVVVSARGAHQALRHDELAQAVAGQLGRALSLPMPVAARVLQEKRATIVPAPGIGRPSARLGPGLFLASDAADSPYPSTIEGSVRSGLAAAQRLLAGA